MNREKSLQRQNFSVKCQQEETSHFEELKVNNLEYVSKLLEFVKNEKKNFKSQITEKAPSSLKLDNKKYAKLLQNNTLSFHERASLSNIYQNYLQINIYSPEYQQYDDNLSEYCGPKISESILIRLEKLKILMNSEKFQKIASDESEKLVQYKKQLFKINDNFLVLQARQSRNFDEVNNEMNTLAINILQEIDFLNIKHSYDMFQRRTMHYIKKESKIMNFEQCIKLRDSLNSIKDTYDDLLIEQNQNQKIILQKKLKQELIDQN